MRRMMLGALAGAGLLIAAFAGIGRSDPGFGTLPTSAAAVTRENGLITLYSSGADGLPLTLTVFDPREQWIGIYHVDRATGMITLKSARKITWDLQLVEFNGVKPSPQDIRSSLQR